MPEWWHGGRRGRFGPGAAEWAAMAGGRGRRGPGPFGFGRGPRGGFFFGGPPFGGPPFGPPPFMRGGRAGRGNVRAAVLALLAEQPLHGYQIIQEISERSGGLWRPSPGSVYPAVQQLEDEGLVRIEQVEGRRMIHLTDAGEAYVREHADELDAPWEAVAGGVSDGVLELHDLLGQVGAAVVQVAHAGSERQAASARQILADTRRSLYRILADGDVEPDDLDQSGADRA